jgi:formylmethanofuran dehydrogenase subunit E
MKDISSFLAASAQFHQHLCPRQVLGVRLGMLGLKIIQLEANLASKRLLVITETDGCFVDGLCVVTGCTVGHRTLRVEDYGKTAATFVDTWANRAIRVAPLRDIRSRAQICAEPGTQPYEAQMQAYQVLPDHEMFSYRDVTLKTPLEQILSQPGLRVCCSQCGEEIMNAREVQQGDQTLCQPCAQGGYYQAGQNHSNTMSFAGDVYNAVQC